MSIGDTCLPVQVKTPRTWCKF